MPRTTIDTAVPSAESGRKPIRRTAEQVIAGAAAVLTLVLLGGFSLVINSTNAQTFADSLYPLLADAGMSGGGVGVDQAYQATRTLAAWFGVTVIVVVVLTAIGIFVARQRPSRKIAGWWFLAAGLGCLLGSQLIAYPVAFLFFVSAGLFALRKPDQGVSHE